MGRRSFDTLGQVLFWSYANLAMADAAVEDGVKKYSVPYYMIRAKMYKSLCEGTMTPRSLYFDERDKLLSKGRCGYCGSDENPSLDHLFPRFVGGSDAPENLIFCCKSCNSSKGKRDALLWSKQRGRFLPLSVLRRYLKLAILHSAQNDLMDTPREAFSTLDVPFSIDDIPMKYPLPSEMVWSY